MPTFGYALLLLALVVATYTGGAAIVGHRARSPRMLESANFGVLGLFGLLTAASSVLVYLFVVGDYSVKYVQQYSDRSMPLFYKATAFWGGQSGSLLFWVWVMSVWSAIAVYQNRNKNRELMPYTIVTMMWVALFFLTLLVFVVNPFETSVGAAPTDGRGLNPLLQNPYMVTHPPSLYLGYIGWTIPFCFAMGALAHGKLDYAWIDSMRRWCLVAWICLSVGLTLGGLWAYEELGWGGYWAWDPVENAAFMPWLTGTAFIHSIQVQERRRIFKLWNIVLIIITFVLTLLGTMMTRSGIVESVHAFAQSNIGDVFLGFLAVTTAASLSLLVWRAKDLRPEAGIESLASREFAFLVNNWVLLAASFFVTFATLFPAIYKWLSGQTINVGPSFYNVWMVPIGLILLFLTGVGPLLSWRRSSGDTLRQQFLVPGVLGVIATVIIAYLSKTVYAKDSLGATLTLGCCVFVTATLAQEFWRGARLRMKNAEEGAFEALSTLVQKAKRRYGGYVVHFGVMLMFLGFAGESFKLESQATVKRGETTTLGRYTMRLERLVFEDDGQKNMATAEISVFDAESGAALGTLKPGKWMYRKPEEQVTTEVDKRMSLVEDLYLVLASIDGDDKAVLQIKINPLVNFVWLGCSFLMFGFAIAVWPERGRARAALWSRQGALAATGWATFLLGVLTAALAIV
jgi:cytochrome c-type biogenesis protein CcmF